MAFWRNILNNNPELAAWFVNEIRDTAYKNETVASQEYKVGAMTLPRLITFLKTVSASAESLRGCRQV